MFEANIDIGTLSLKVVLCTIQANTCGSWLKGTKQQVGVTKTLDLFNFHKIISSSLEVNKY